tara:strand:+ start:183 stop:446 length:264 start_codon:yes stop_codon:yes gene_type:complete
MEIETLEDQIITLEKKIKELKHVLSFRSSELKQGRNRAWEISEAMEEGIEECMDAESCWARACAIADGEDTYSTMSPFDDEKSVDKF